MITNLEHFSIFVRHIKKLFDEHKARYFFDTASRIELVLTDRQETNSLAKELNIEKKSLEFTINLELPALFFAAISGERSHLEFLFRVNEEEDNLEYQKRKELVEEKIKIIEEFLITQKMRDGFLIKKTSKINFLSGVDWEVNTKTFDDGEGKIPNLTYSILRLNLSNSEKISQFFPFSILIGEKKNDITLNLDLNDIDNLIDILSDIRKALNLEVQ